ncbi:MAG: prepilin-type N-terminal cleavage/methylation domain-containing protein [Actinobacteria bacterium]|nr:prepilin-type N-terminal cleavage/methylation domain-containing protein [Actinomycetota bacterium]
MRDIGNRGTRSSEAGFTIIEMMVALSLLVVAMVPLAVVLTTSLRTSVKTNTRMLAREVGASEIDKARSLRFEALGINGVASTFSSPGPTTIGGSFQIGPDAGLTGLNSGPEIVSMTTQGGGNSFTVTRDVRKVARGRSVADTLSYVKEVNITVTWTSPEPGGTETFPAIIGPTDMAN